MIHDWEIGALYWNCLQQTEGDEVAANALVKQRYFTEFLEKRDVYFFLGTIYQYHKRKMHNPYSIIGGRRTPKVVPV
jgi:hypothetical protein